MVINTVSCLKYPENKTKVNNSYNALIKYWKFVKKILALQLDAAFDETTFAEIRASGWSRLQQDHSLLCNFCRQVKICFV